MENFILFNCLLHVICPLFRAKERANATRSKSIKFFVCSFLSFFLFSSFKLLPKFGVVSHAKNMCLNTSSVELFINRRKKTKGRKIRLRQNCVIHLPCEKWHVHTHNKSTLWFWRFFHTNYSVTLIVVVSIKQFSQVAAIHFHLLTV